MAAVVPCASGRPAAFASWVRRTPGTKASTASPATAHASAAVRRSRDPDRMAPVIAVALAPPSTPPAPPPLVAARQRGRPASRERYGTRTCSSPGAGGSSSHGVYPREPRDGSPSKKAAGSSVRWRRRLPRLNTAQWGLAIGAVGALAAVLALPPALFQLAWRAERQSASTAGSERNELRHNDLRYSHHCPVDDHRSADDHNDECRRRGGVRLGER